MLIGPTNDLSLPPPVASVFFLNLDRIYVSLSLCVSMCRIVEDGLPLRLL